MSAKPTPGPTVDETLAGDFDVMTNGVRVARFFQHGPIGPKEARANAEAWIAGMEEIGKLERVRQLVERWKGDGIDSDVALTEIARILIARILLESKP